MIEYTADGYDEHIMCQSVVQTKTVRRGKSAIDGDLGPSIAGASRTLADTVDNLLYAQRSWTDATAISLYLHESQG